MTSVCPHQSLSPVFVLAARAHTVNFLITENHLWTHQHGLKFHSPFITIHTFFIENLSHREICGGEERLSHQHHTYAVFLPWQPSYVQMLSGIIIRCDHNITDFISAALCTVKPLLTFMFCIFITCPNLMKTDYKLDNMLYLFGSQRPLI